MNEAEYDIFYFIRCLNIMNVQGQKRRMWLNSFKKNPEKTGEMYYDKLEREYRDTEVWEIAKNIIHEKRPELNKGFPDGFQRKSMVTETPIVPVPEPQPEIIDFEYFFRLNKGSWGDICFDCDEYEAKHGIIL